MIEFISAHILSLLIVLPLLFGLLLLGLPKEFEKGKAFETITILGLLIEWLASLHLLYHFNIKEEGFQFAENYPWIPELGIHFSLGIDGLSLLLVLLTTFVGFLVSMSFLSFSFKGSKRALMALFFLMQAALIGVFCACDTFLFYTFWELTLIPAYFMIGFWGQTDAKIKATQKVFFYGLAGSLSMLAALIFIYVFHGNHSQGTFTTNTVELTQSAQNLDFSTQSWLFLALTIGFFVKAPLFPFHRWLIDAYEEAPVLYTFMSGVILKLATYGMIRFSMSFFPQVVAHYAPYLILLGLISFMYGAFIAWRETSLRRLMAFSSLSHLGLICVGLFSLSSVGLSGAIYQKTDLLEKYSGLAKEAPLLSTFFILSIFSAVGLPGTGSFIGEFLILFSTFYYNPLLGLIASLSVILGALYMLKLAYQVVWGPSQEESKEASRIQISKPQIFQLSLLVGLMIVLGFSATYVLQYSNTVTLKLERLLQGATPSDLSFQNEKAPN
jgi:NADH-quinone oxidoreductase subunit M